VRAEWIGHDMAEKPWFFLRIGLLPDRITGKTAVSTLPIEFAHNVSYGLTCARPGFPDRELGFWVSFAFQATHLAYSTESITMSQRFLGLVIGLLVCLTVSLAQGQGRGKSEGRSSSPNKGGERQGGEKQGRESQGGERQGSERQGGGKQNSERSGSDRSPGGNRSDGRQTGDQHREPNAESNSRNNSRSTTGLEGATAGEAHRNAYPATGAQGAAAGATAANRNSPNATGAEGAAAGAAYTNRNAPQMTGAQGAAVGTAAANRNSPNATGAEGAAFGAAAANRNSPQMTGAQGAAVGAAATNRNAPATNGATGAVAGYAAARNSVNYSNFYSQQWYGSNPGAWMAAGWTAGTAWTPTNWNGVANYFGYNNVAPISYNYGANVTYLNGNVLMGSQNLGTAEQYSQQAANLARAGSASRTSTSETWLPLGVFGLVRNAQDQPQLILQLAVDQQGNLRGNYTDEVTGSTLPIYGAVDQKTQRVAWIIGNDQTSVMEAGLSNLTQAEAPTLLHKNGQTENWLLVRLNQGN